MRRIHESWLWRNLGLSAALLSLEVHSRMVGSPGPSLMARTPVATKDAEDSRILALEKLGAMFNQVSTALEYTPRRFVIQPETNSLILIETDHNAYTEDTKLQRKQQMAEVRRLFEEDICKIW